MWTEFFIGVGTLCAISVFLALIMVIADRTIGNYGEVTLTINDDKKLIVSGGKPLLATLMEQKIFIPSACGGRGSCGLCKVKVLEGAGEYLPTELPWISSEEKLNHIRLSCQVKVKKDMSISIPEELFNVKQYQAKVTRLRDLTYDIKEVTLQLLDPDIIQFKPGQFIQLQVPPYALTAESVYRAYSIASSPSRNHEVQLEIRLVPNGICTTYVHKYLKEGDSVILNGPYGDFYLQNTQAEMICIAGGSGMAPMKSIISHMAEHRIDRKITYFFGARSKRDLFLEEEMKELEEKLPQFRFVPCLSEPRPEDLWTGEIGLVTQIVERSIADGENKEAYLCGSPGMINACVEVLNRRGIPKEKIYFDNFG